jgi:hypothetical protein
VGARAAEILAAVQGSDEYGRLAESAQKYADCWATFTGYMIISRWDLDTDTEPLFNEALRVLALKSAVFELSGADEEAAELIVSAPVDDFGWRRGDYTHECYQAAGWGGPDPRYWIDADETGRRLTVLNSKYAAVGIGRDLPRIG